MLHSGFTVVHSQSSSYRTPWFPEDFPQFTKDLQSKFSHFTFYLVFLFLLPLSLQLLLFLQLLCDAGFPEWLPFAALVGLGVEGCLQGGVLSHTANDFSSQLQVRKSYHKLCTALFRSRQSRFSSCNTLLWSNKRYEKYIILRSLE